MEAKLIKDLGNGRFEIEIPKIEKQEYRETEFGICHDYVYFDGYGYLQNPNGSISDKKIWTSIHIPIRGFLKIVLPKLLESEYTKPEHLKDREYTEDDKYFTKYGLDKPRYKKGDKYPAYSYNNEVINFYDSKTKTKMVAFLIGGEAEYNIVTRKVFDEFIKDKLKFKF